MYNRTFSHIYNLFLKLQKTLPVRHKEVHGINVHTSMKFLCDFGLSLVSEKIKKRVKLYSSLNDLMTSGNIDVSLLPKEYGGEMPMSEMIGNTNYIIFVEN